MFWKIVERLSTPKVMGALRHLTGTLGTVAATYGFMTEVQGVAVSGAVFAALAFLLSALAPEKKESR